MPWMVGTVLWLWEGRVSGSFKTLTWQSFLSSLLRSVLLPVLLQLFPGRTWASAQQGRCLLMFGLFRWGGGAEVWFFNTSALLFCCRPPQTSVKFRFQHGREPFTFWLSHWFSDWQHFVLRFPAPGQSHHGFFWNVRQSYHCFSPLITHHRSLSFCYRTVKSHTLFKLLPHSRVSQALQYKLMWTFPGDTQCYGNTEIWPSVYF